MDLLEMKASRITKLLGATYDSSQINPSALRQGVTDKSFARKTHNMSGSGKQVNPFCNTCESHINKASVKEGAVDILAKKWPVLSCLPET